MSDEEVIEIPRDEYFHTNLDDLLPSMTASSFRRRLQAIHPSQFEALMAFTTNPQFHRAFFLGTGHERNPYTIMFLLQIFFHEPSVPVTWSAGNPPAEFAHVPIHPEPPMWVPTRYHIPNTTVYRCNCPHCRTMTEQNNCRPRGSSSHMWVFVFHTRRTNPTAYIQPVMDWIGERSPVPWRPFIKNRGPHRLIPRRGHHDTAFLYQSARDPLFTGSPALYLPFTVRRHNG